MFTQYDALEIRCPALGHQLSFKYCRSANENAPCRKILDCWFQRINIQEFIAEHYSEAELQRITAEPKPKLVSILEIISRVQGHREQ